MAIRFKSGKIKVYQTIRTCPICGRGFTHPSRKVQFCSRNCADRSQARTHQRSSARWKTTNCKQCGIVFTRKLAKKEPGLFCSYACRDASRRKPKVSRINYYTCLHCGSFKTSRLSTQKCCSRECHYLAWKNSGKYEADKARRRVEYKEPIPEILRYCKQCNREFFTKRNNKLYCCVNCQRLSENSIGQTVLLARPDHLRNVPRRILEKMAYRAPVIREEIYERDGWKCGICHKVVNPNLQHPHPMSKSLDHIIPLINGGTHEPRNVQLAHLACNVARQTRGLVQLRLF